jgi:hypothetical protein
MFTINMGHLVSGATMAQPTIESAGYVKKRMAHGKYFEIPRRGFSFSSTYEGWPSFLKMIGSHVRSIIGNSTQLSRETAKHNTSTGLST